MKKEELFLRVLENMGLECGQDKYNRIIFKLDNERNIEEILNLAKEDGIDKIMAITTQKQYTGEILSQCLLTDIGHYYKGLYKMDAGNLNFRLPWERMKEFDISSASKIFGKLKPITYPVLGNLNRMIQKDYLEGKLGKENFNADSATITSLILNTSISIAYLGACFANAISDTKMPWASHYVLGGISLGIDGIRIGSSLFLKGTSGSYANASLMGDILGWPLVSYYRNMLAKEEKEEKKGHRYAVTFSISPGVEATG